jgi:hypothetical protein
MEVIPGLIVLLIVAALYFLPALIASGRHHHQAAAIWVLNLLLGWTGVGWCAAAVWSCTATPAAQPMAQPPHQS